jgi:Protein chain release factor B
LTKSGKIIIKVNKHKSQKRNKSEAVIRLIDYFNKSIETPKKRYKTKPKLSSIKKRLTDKRRNSIKKNLRKKPKLE